MAVRVEVRAGVTVVSIDRPQVRNAVDAATAAALAAAFRRFDADPEQPVAVLTGTGGAFCAGADLRAVAAREPRRLSDDGDGPMGPTRMRLSKPVIAAIEGPAVAGGLELAVWCDLRVAAENAYFGVYNRRFGVPLIDLGTIRLPRLLGQGRALDLILTGRRVDAGEAMRIGLVDRLVPAGGALEAALALAREIAAFPQTSLRGDRLSVLEQWDLPESAAIANEVRRGRAAIDSGEAVTGAGEFARGRGRHGER